MNYLSNTMKGHNTRGYNRVFIFIACLIFLSLMSVIEANAAEAAVFTVDTDRYTVFDEDTTITITVNKTSVSEQESTVRLYTFAGTASDPDDYTAINQVLTFPQGAAAIQTVTLTIKNNSLNPCPKDFAIIIADATGDVPIGSPNSISISILAVEPEASPFGLSTTQIGQGFSSIYLWIFIGLGAAVMLAGIFFLYGITKGEGAASAIPFTEIVLGATLAGFIVLIVYVVAINVGNFLA